MTRRAWRTGCMAWCLIIVAITLLCLVAISWSQEKKPLAATDVAQWQTYSAQLEADMKLKAQKLG